MTCFNPLEKMSEQCEYLLESGKPSDVVLVAGGKELRAHKVTLSARSPVFAAMFAHSTTKEAQESRVEIDDVDVEVLEMLVRYIYTGQIDNLDNNTAELLIAADKYQVDCLKSICEDQLVSQISIKTVSDLLTFSNMYQVTELTTECLEYIINNSTRVMALKGWNNIVARRSDLLAQLCERLLLKHSQLKFSEQQHLSSIADAESVSDLLIIANMHKVGKLVTKYMDYIADNGIQVMASEGWKKIVLRADLLATIFDHLIQKYNQIFEENL